MSQGAAELKARSRLRTPAQTGDRKASSQSCERGTHCKRLKTVAVSHFAGVARVAPRLPTELGGEEEETLAYRYSCIDMCGVAAKFGVWGDGRKIDGTAR